jgi:hypothetical protein
MTEEQQVQFRYANEGKCIDCGWPCEVIHYTVDGSNRVWRTCACGPRPTKDVRDQIDEQQMEERWRS